MHGLTLTAESCLKPIDERQEGVRVYCSHLYLYYILAVAVRYGHKGEGWKLLEHPRDY